MKRRVQIPCPDGIRGCAVFHFKLVDDGIETPNQCDGCRRGLPLHDGIHRGDGYDMIACTASRYESGEVKP